MNSISHTLRSAIEAVLRDLGITDVDVSLEHPTEIAHGDWTTNVAMVCAKKLGKNPRALAEEIVTLMSSPRLDMVESMDVAGPGFINIHLSDAYFAEALSGALAMGETFGNNESEKGKKVIVEYTDPNPFKEFHIGHLMTNTIGESLSRIVEASGAETKRACYQGDVGMQIACAVWGMQKLEALSSSATLLEKVEYLGRAYVHGATAAKNDAVIKGDIAQINKHIYERTDEVINGLYDSGRAWSLAYFEEVYARLGTTFDYYFFESQTGEFGKEVVLTHPDIFEPSDGAIVYRGDEARGLHTRVFINKDGLPTYEAKELGLAKIKFDTYPYETSIVVTANEVTDYFKVLLDAMAKVYPELAMNTEHIGHGVMRLTTGKMSSRTGDIVTAKVLIGETKEKALAKISDDQFTDEEKDEIAERVAIGAIKYSILRQAAGKDIIFDFEQSLSFEGDSGPYLQYTYARTLSLLAKAGQKNADVSQMVTLASPLHKYILRFPEVVLRAKEEREPHHIATYLILIAREFNAFYANTIVLDGSRDEGYKLALVHMTSQILLRGLHLLGIIAPTRM